MLEPVCSGFQTHLLLVRVLVCSRSVHEFRPGNKETKGSPITPKLADYA